MASNRPLRFGILGAARIAPDALVKPAQKSPDAEVVAIAARDPARAREFAATHHIPRVHATYEDLIGDPDLDVIYNPLPNSMHCEWTIGALRAGKHVLCEKPIASNAARSGADGAGGERDRDDLGRGVPLPISSAGGSGAGDNFERHAWPAPPRRRTFLGSDSGDEHSLRLESRRRRHDGFGMLPAAHDSQLFRFGHEGDVGPARKPGRRISTSRWTWSSNWRAEPPRE